MSYGEASDICQVWRMLLNTTPNTAWTLVSSVQ